MKAVVLAAGKSTRLKSAKSKVVHTILGKEIINFLLDSILQIGINPENILLVLGENRDEVSRVVRPDIRIAIQNEQLGTAHALRCAEEFVSGFSGELLVSVGDNPYISTEELQRLIDHHRNYQAHCTFISAIFPGIPPPYGRVIRNHEGMVMDVVEEIDATAEQLKIREVNSSIYLFDNPTVFPRLSRIQNQNAKREYYLTDIIRILKTDGYRLEAIPALDHHISIGINNRWELQEAQNHFNRRRLEMFANDQGVTILQPESTTIEYHVEIGQDTVIYPSSYIAAGTRIGRNCRIGPMVFLKNIHIPDQGEIAFEKRINSNQTE